MSIRITVWNEFRHEKINPKVSKIYPAGIHAAIANGLLEHGLDQVHTATLDEPEHGLTQQVLDETDVLVWWGDKAHKEVRDEIVDRVHARVMSGMGLVTLHSAHFSKIFKKLMGTSCSLKWRDDGGNERIWVVEPGHPIAAHLPECFVIKHEETYGERFDIPTPDTLVFASWFEGGEIFRSGCCYHRGHGKIFYFRPGHEAYPTYHNPRVKQVIANAVGWAAPVHGPVVKYGQYL